MMSEYDLDDILCLPEKMYVKSLDEYYIVIAPQYPNWLVLKESEYRMFSWLKEELSIRKALENYYEQVCQDEDKCLSLMTNLLTQIDDVNFSGTAKILTEEPIDTIKKKVHIGTTNGCNMHCEHCYMAAGTTPLETIELEKTIQLISELNDMYGELEIVVSGGEPLTYRNLAKLLQEIKNNYVILFTNGSLISLNNIDMIAECCDEVQVSFEGISKNFYSKVRGEGYYERVIQALDLLKNRGVRIVLAVTILPDTLEDIEDNLVRFVKEFNYNNLEVRINDEIEMSGNALSMDMSAYKKGKSKATVIDLVRKLRRIGCVIHESDVRNIQFTNCGIGTNIVINYDGKIYPCHKFSDYAFEIGTSTDKIIKAFDSINKETSNRFIKKCQNCELKYICAGGCRIDNLIETGNMNTVICNEELKEEQYRKLLSDYKMYLEMMEQDGK